MRAAFVVLAACFALAGCRPHGRAALPATAPASAPGDGNVVERFDIPKSLRGPLALPVTLAGKTYLFAVDTGSTFNVVDPSLAPLLGPSTSEMRVETAGDPIVVKAFPMPPAWLGRLTLQTDAPVVVSNLQEVRNVTGVEVYGIIGMTFLRGYVVRIDGDRGVLEILRTVDPDAGIRVPLTFERLCPNVKVTLAGIPTPETFLVDTGNGSSGDLRQEVYAALTLQGKIDDAGEVRAETASGTFTTRKGRVEAMVWGAGRHQGLIFARAPQNGLGLGLLSRYVVKFDFAGAAMYVTKSQRFGVLEPRDFSGLGVGRVHGRTVVRYAVDGSPAQLAGLQAGDEITSVDAQPAGALDLYGLRLRLCEEGKVVRLGVVRRGEERDVDLLLRDWVGDRRVTVP